MVSIPTRFEGCTQPTWLLENCYWWSEITRQRYWSWRLYEFHHQEEHRQKVLTTTLADDVKSSVAKYEEVWATLNECMLQDHMQMSLQRKKNWWDWITIHTKKRLIHSWRNEMNKFKSFETWTQVRCKITKNGNCYYAILASTLVLQLNILDKKWKKQLVTKWNKHSKWSTSVRSIPGKKKPK